jgi:uncharacterized membrane protein
VTPQMGLFFGSLAFIATHLLLSHPLRKPLVGRMGEGPFRGFYSIVAILLLGLMIWSYRAIGPEPQMWPPTEAMWAAGAILMSLGSILLVGSFVGNPALPGSRGPTGGPKGVFTITRHPMMWAFALWAIVHLMLVATVKGVVLDGTILILALGGSVLQDRKKAGLMGETWHEWTAQTAFVPFSRGLGSPGMFALVGGTLLFLLATWLHPMPVGIWRWIA